MVLPPSGRLLQLLSPDHDVERGGRAGQRRGRRARPGRRPVAGAVPEQSGTSWQDRFERTGDLAALAEAALAARAATESARDDDSDRGRYWSNLRNTLRTIFEWTGDLAVLRESVDAGRHGVAATPTGHPDRPMTCPTSGPRCTTSPSGPGDPAGLDEAVALGRAAVEAAGERATWRWSCAPGSTSAAISATPVRPCSWVGAQSP